MNRRNVIRFLLTSLLLTLVAVDATRADCVRLSPASMKERSQWVFAGRLAEKKPLQQGFELTFDVQRVWKGDVARTAVLHQRQSLVSVRLDEGKEYLVFGQLIPEDDRRGFGIEPGEASFIVPDCNGAMQMPMSGKSLRGLGRSQRPPDGP